MRGAPGNEGAVCTHTSGQGSCSLPTPHRRLTLLPCAWSARGSPNLMGEEGNVRPGSRRAGTWSHTQPGPGGWGRGPVLALAQSKQPPADPTAAGAPRPPLAQPGGQVPPWARGKRPGVSGLTARSLARGPPALDCARQTKPGLRSSQATPSPAVNTVVSEAPCKVAPARTSCTDPNRPGNVWLSPKGVQASLTDPGASCLGEVNGSF